MFDGEFRRRRSPRRRAIGAAGVLGSLAGAALAGQCMIFLGWFMPGTTPNEQILAYWPGFLAGALLGGLAASLLARFLAGKLGW